MGAGGQKCSENARYQKIKCRTISLQQINTKTLFVAEGHINIGLLGEQLLIDQHFEFTRTKGTQQLHTENQNTSTKLTLKQVDSDY